MTDVDALIDEGLSTPISGWDFGRFGDRLRSLPPPWDFDAAAASALAAAGAALDMGTGGGEWLSGLFDVAGVPAAAVAAEGWAPNVPVAAARLTPYGVGLVHYAGAPDNVDQDAAAGRAAAEGLPFATGAFDVVLNRHESYEPREVARVLRPGGVFLTQQVADGWDAALRAALGLPPPEPTGWDLAFAVAQAEAGGLVIVDAGEAPAAARYADVAPLIWYARMSSWALAGFDPAAERSRWRAVQRRIDDRGPLELAVPRFWLRARPA